MKPLKSLKHLLLVHELTFVLLVTLAGAAGGYGIHQWQAASRESLRINQLVQEIQQTRGDMYRQMKELFDAYFLADATANEEYNGFAVTIAQRFDTLGKLARGPEEAKAIHELQLSYSEYLTETGRILQRRSRISYMELTHVLNSDMESKLLRRFETISAAAEALLALKQQELQTSLENSRHAALTLMAIPVALAVVLLLFSHGFLQRAIVRPIAALLRATTEISAGKLEHKAPETGAIELANLSRAINDMAADLAHSREALIRTEKQAAQGALVPVLAHNIRNPLASIRATAQVADSAKLDGETRESLQDIIGTVDRLERWTGALLAYLHPLKPQLASISVNQLIDGALSPLEQKLKEKSLTIKRDGCDGNATLMADDLLLEQALYNLLLNAAEASPANGVIDISCAVAEELITLRIADSGPGMPFTPEYSILIPGPSTKRFGTGLGIPFAYKVCEAHGGGINFAAREGGGTVITLTLPRRPPETVGPEATP
ncbi:MAG: HAMP domain-containing protein [Nitrosomonadales bacterium]|nr:MAG: HAMP domain-containing protein [Nitrosomonadales bacterium]